MITDLRAQHFRSYKDASFELGEGVNIVVGPNASGKTNLLEAVLMLALGRSYRAKDADLVQFGQTWARLDADLAAGTRTVKIALNDTTRKTFTVDDQELSRLTHQRTMPVVLFEPNHLLLLSGSPELRRAFLDDLIEQISPGFASVRRHYRRVLTQRNTLLKKRPADLSQQLFVWNVRCSELGGKIAQERHRLITRFNERIADVYGNLAGHKNKVELGYASSLPRDVYETALLGKLEQNQDLDAARGFTAYGPHRDDLAGYIDGHPVQEAASRGEIRTLVLALKLLELHFLEEVRGQKPLLLLDDVFSELDGKRRANLTAFVNGYQTFITTTDADMVVRHFTACNLIPTTS